MIFVKLIIYYFIQFAICQENPTISFITKESVVNIGDSLGLSCSVQSAHNCVVIWAKINRVNPHNNLFITKGTSISIPDNRYSLRYNDSSFTYTLKISNMNEMDGGLYQCLVVLGTIRVTADVNVYVRDTSVNIKMSKNNSCSETNVEANTTYSGDDSSNFKSNHPKTRSPTFSFSESPSFEHIRQILQQVITEHDHEKHHSPRNVLLALVGEVGELAQLFQWRDDAVLGLANWSISDRLRVEQQLSDVLLYLIRMADRCRIDLPNATIRKLQLNAINYPKN